MIVRRESYNGFLNFDFFNDATDTAEWLHRVGRHKEATELLDKYEQWIAASKKTIGET